MELTLASATNLDLFALDVNETADRANMKGMVILRLTLHQKSKKQSLAPSQPYPLQL